MAKTKTSPAPEPEPEGVPDLEGLLPEIAEELRREAAGGGFDGRRDPSPEVAARDVEDAIRLLPHVLRIAGKLLARRRGR